MKLIDIATKTQESSHLSMRQKQLKLFKVRAPSQFGGVLLKGNAKVARPLSTKHAIHLVLKSQLAVGSRSMLHRKNIDAVETIVRRKARENDLKLYHFVNVGNHLHLVVRVRRASALTGRRAFQRFLRSVSGLIARHVLRAERGRASREKFWQARPFSRLISWGRDFNSVTNYMARNISQAKSFVAWGFAIVDPERIARLETG